MKSKRLKPCRPSIPETDILRTGPSIYFVRKASQITDSLFIPGGTASGTFKVKSNGILFHKPDGAPFAFLVANDHGERFFVSCSRSEPDGGSIRYMFSTSTKDEEFLGLPDSHYGQHEVATAIWDLYGKNPATV